MCASVLTARKRGLPSSATKQSSNYGVRKNRLEEPTSTLVLRSEPRPTCFDRITMAANATMSRPTRREGGSTAINHNNGNPFSLARPLCGWSLRSSQSLLIFILLQQSLVLVVPSATASTISGATLNNGQCFPEDTTDGLAYACADNPTYYSHLGLPCSFHASLLSSDGENCFHLWLAGVDTGATWLAKKYDEDQIFELIWECPCSCNIKCFDGDDGDGLEPTASPTSKPLVQVDENNSAAAGTYNSIGDVGYPSESESDQNQNEEESEEQAAETREGNNEADETVLSVVAPAVAVDADPSHALEETGDTGFFLSNSLRFVAMIAASVVGLVVVYVSVFSLIQSMQKSSPFESAGTTCKEHTTRNDENDLQIVSNLSDISDSVASANSLSTEDKIRLYRAWKLALTNRRGIEDTYDVVEP